jgi:hypothetical protein
MMFMRALVFTAALVLIAPNAIAQQLAERPAAPAPAATAPFEQRESWCQKYAAWFVERSPSETPALADVRASHRLEIELNSCKLDPREYERQTLAELARLTTTRTG